MDVSRRAEEVTSFLVMDILEEANRLSKEGMDIIHLEVGEPDFPTPQCVVDAAKKAMEEGKTHYTHSLGLPELRDAIAEHYKLSYHVRVDPNRILITSGSSPALMIAYAAILDPGSDIIMSDPCYACYPNFARIFSANVRSVPLKKGDMFQLDPDDVIASVGGQTRAIMINSPANPTGVIMDVDHMKAIANIGPLVISDEIYHGLVYEGREHTILEFTDNAIVINGFSKKYAMTGWRIGWMVLPEYLVRPAQKIQQNLMICAPSIAQWAAIAALRDAKDDVERMRDTFAARRKVMLEQMHVHGFNVEVVPTGAFYVLVSMKSISVDSYALAFDILRNTGVGVTPGIDFGRGAEGYIRFSYAASSEDIVQGIDRVGGYIKSL